ncbi:MAG: DNA/RNA nuclease SfsA [Abditibacteriota bacterium]|nr:DNA/RNA nuclease SfsA [Abditibacteriota bacterium]
MKNNNIYEGVFIERPNRFIAKVLINGKTETVHVKNTGRCKEILTPGVPCYLEKSQNPNRKTSYDLIAVEKGDRLINIDSQAVNKVFLEFLQSGGLFKDITLIKPETTFGKSRFDFYIERRRGGAFIEVKGVTLERDGVMSFPDAPTERGTKHINELIQAHKVGYETYIVFVVQTEKVKYFTPNYETDLIFGQSLKEAKQKGVKVLAYDCSVTPDEISILKKIKIKL